MHSTNTEDKPALPDLNLLRLFDAVYRLRSVSRAALALGLSQPAASQGLTRLRLQLRDALFVRAGGGVRPTPRAERLATAVQQALPALEQAMNRREDFDPARAASTLRLHLSDIGEARFLPELLSALHQRAPLMRVHSVPLPHDQIAGAGSGALRLTDLKKLEVVAVRSHAETLRIVQLLGLTQRLVSAHFLALPAIVRHTDLGVVMPRAIAQGFAAEGGFAIVESGLPRSAFTVSLHWSARHEHDPAHGWLRALLLELFQGRPSAG